jgi:hypothetical protein
VKGEIKIKSTGDRKYFNLPPDKKRNHLPKQKEKNTSKKINGKNEGAKRGAEEKKQEGLK